MIYFYTEFFQTIKTTYHRLLLNKDLIDFADDYNRLELMPDLVCLTLYRSRRMVLFSVDLLTARIRK